MNVYKLKKLFVSSFMITAVASAVVPFAVSAAVNSSHGVVRVFTSSYNDKSTWDYNGIEMTCTCKLEDTNRGTSTLSTITGDEKRVEIYMYNKNGTGKSKTATSRTASATVTDDETLFTPTHTLHSFYSSEADTEINIWYND